MNLYDIWKKLGNQTIKNLKQEAYVFVGNETFKITSIRYRNGIPIGFETKPKIQWYSEMIKPEVHIPVVVRNEKGEEFSDHYWNGHAWYRFYDGDGWRSDVDIVSWRHQ